jgi:hypothetical protein
MSRELSQMVATQAAARAAHETAHDETPREGGMRWPEFDSDPTRRISMTDLLGAMGQQRIELGARVADLAVVVATGSPVTPWANIMGFTTVTFPDGRSAIVLEL